MLRAATAEETQLSERNTVASETLWLRNGPAFPYDLCFDFTNRRLLFLRAGSLPTGSAAFLGSMLKKGRELEQYDLIEDLTLEERLKTDKESIIIPFDSVARLVLRKPWGRTPFLLIKVNVTADGAPSTHGAHYVRKHEFVLSSERRLRDEQVRQIRQAMPGSGLGQRFEDDFR
jgi:hypothetical protein